MTNNNNNYNFIESTAEGAKVNIMLLHGYADHIGRYNTLIKELNYHQCNVYGVDFRGHGKSFGKRAYVNSFEEYLEDLDWLYDRVPRENLKIYAHSMGALVALKWLLTRKNNVVKSVVFSSGLFQLDDSVAPLLRKIAKYISFLAPWFKAEKLDPDKISKIPEEVEKYRNDPLIYHGGAYARVGYEMMKAMQFVQDHADELDINSLFIQGDCDSLTNMNGSQLIYDNIKSTKKQIHILEGGYHELLNDTTSAKYLEIVVNYLSN